VTGRRKPPEHRVAILGAFGTDNFGNDDDGISVIDVDESRAPDKGSSVAPST
jgi:hypothetical protein